MRKLIVTTAGILMFAAAPAFAACTDDVAEAEAALTTVQLSDGDRATAQALLDQARQQAEGGDEASCEATVAQAKTILGM